MALVKSLRAALTALRKPHSNLILKNISYSSCKIKVRKHQILGPNFKMTLWKINYVYSQKSKYNKSAFVDGAMLSLV